MNDEYNKWWINKWMNDEWWMMNKWWWWWMNDK